MDNLSVKIMRAKNAIQCEEYGHAIQLIQQAIQLDSKQATPYYLLGIIFLRQDIHNKALSCFKTAVRFDPDYVEAQFQLGLLYLSCGDLLLSRECFSKAVAIDKHNWQALGNLCMVLRDLGELNEASKVGKRAAQLNPDFFAVWHNLGNVYKDMGKYLEAASHYAKAIKINPECAGTHVGMGISLHRSGDTERAVESFENALNCKPSEGTAISNLCNIYMMECEWEKVNLYKQLIHDSTIKSLQNNQVPSETPFLNITRSDDPKLNFAVAKSWSRDIDKRMTGIRKSLGFQYRINDKDKIRIGYISNNFGDHPTAHITRRLYELHERKRFKVLCYSYGVDDDSYYRKSVQSGCDTFVDISNLSNAEAAKRINDDGVDILVDLVGDMRGGKIAIASLRPAPVQVRWLGMAGTTGADFFDYLITDKIVTPQDQSKFYSEKFIYLPGCYQINDNQPFAAKCQFLKSDFGIPEDVFVFCCFNTSYKIDANVFSAWMRILKRSAESVLWLMAHSANMQENVKKAAQRHSVDPARLLFAEKIPKPRHLSRLPLADLALDTLTVNGAASTSDALWAGVPVLTIRGKHFASRMSASILTAVGLDSLIAADLESYVEQAIQLSKKRLNILEIKRILVNNRKKKPLFDTEQFVALLESAYKRLWQKHINGYKPMIIDIEKE
jgi:protein O-GlcNAc transferase